MYKIEGLQSAVDFTKYLIALAGGAIAFVIKPEFYTTDPLLKILSTLSLGLLSISVISGLLVFSAGCVMLSSGNYSLRDRFIKIPGIINVVTFGFGFIFLAIAVCIKIWGKN